MKIILTEHQLMALLSQEGVAQFLHESYLKNKNLENLKKIVKRLLTLGIAVSTIISVINRSDAPLGEKEILTKAVMAYEEQPDIFKNTLENSPEYKEKVEACRKYMEYALKNQGYTLASTNLKPETLVKTAMEKSFDLPFLMAAAHQESCFGATPRAQKTNSVFSEGSWDNGKNMVTYSDPNDSVAGYIDLLNRSYIVNGKNLLDLLKPGAFVNGVGNRYASDASYEQKLRNLRNRIIRNYPELKSV